MDVDGADAEAVGGGWVATSATTWAGGSSACRPGPPRPAPLPAFALAFYDHVVRCDAQRALVVRGAVDASAPRRWARR